MKNQKAIVMESATTPSGNCWGSYRRVAVVIVDVTTLPEGLNRPKFIGDRARGTVAVLRTWENCNVGITERCAYQRALKAADALAAQINGAIEALGHRAREITWNSVG